MENPSSAAVWEEIGGSAGNNSECGGGSDEPPRSDSVAGDEYTVNVTQLDPGATYVFCVGYSSGKFRSDWSASQELSTLQGESMDPLASEGVRESESEWLRAGCTVYVHGCMEALGCLAGGPDFSEAVCIHVRSSVHKEREGIAELL